MRDGRFEDAWAISAQVLHERDPATRDDPRLPPHLRWVWDGSPLDGRHVRVRCYHGLGDTIQFARFLPMVAERAASLTVEIQPRLLDLLGGMSADSGFACVPFDPSQPPSPSECEIEITELDFALRLRPDLAPLPYLHAARAVLPPGTVAFCYGAGDWDPSRSAPPELFATLCHQGPCITLMPEPTTLDVLNPEGCPFDIGATAALIAGAALVVTVDTMVAHLAGALGKPVWLLSKSEPDWRWPAPDRRSPWYPSMRFYAQPCAGDWKPVLSRVEADLAGRGLAVGE